MRIAALTSSRISNAQGSNGTRQKRPAPDNLKGVAKRMRSGTQQDAIVIDSDDEDDINVGVNDRRSSKDTNGPETNINSTEVLKAFRLPARSLQ